MKWAIVFLYIIVLFQALTINTLEQAVRTLCHGTPALYCK